MYHKPFFYNILTELYPLYFEYHYSCCIFVTL